MDSVISTQRLRLTLITTAEPGSEELSWIHELRTNEEAMWWSLGGVAKSIDDHEDYKKRRLPIEDKEGSKTYRILYAVHEQSEHLQSTRFIGLINLCSVEPKDTFLPDHLSLPNSDLAETLVCELAYSFLPAAWGKGYATESLRALFSRVEADSTFWTPWKQVYVRIIVNAKNLKSLRVLEKMGAVQRGIFDWTGDAIWLTGRWVTEDRILVFEKHFKVAD